jgi:hypothetical protein
MGAIGVKKEAGEALSDLAAELFGMSPQYRRGTTFKDVFDELSDIIILNFFEKRTIASTDADVAFVESKIEQ